MLKWNWRHGAARIPVTKVEIRHCLTPDDIARALSASLVVEWESGLPLPGSMSRTAITAMVRQRLLCRGDNYCDEGWGDNCGGDDADIAAAWAYQQVALAWPEHAAHVTWGRTEFERGDLAKAV